MCARCFNELLKKTKSSGNWNKCALCRTDISSSIYSLRKNREIFYKKFHNMLVGSFDQIENELDSDENTETEDSQ